MHVALWLPDVPEGTVIPVIMTIHPYYDFGGEGVAGDDSAPNTVPDGGVGKWVYDTFVPHGYALAQASTLAPANQRIVRTSKAWENKPGFRQWLTGWASKCGQTVTWV